MVLLLFVHRQETLISSLFHSALTTTTINNCLQRESAMNEVERREKKLEEALKHIEGMCVFENICITELTRKEALNTITWIRERAREALEQEV
jgi:hypothetical protein